MGGSGNLRVGGVVRPVGDVRAQDVESGAAVVGSDGQHRGRNLGVVAAQDERGVHAVAGQHAQQQVADRVGAHRACGAHSRSQLGQYQRGTGSRARRAEPDLVHQGRALAFRSALDGPDLHVEHVGTESNDCLAHRVLSSPSGRVVP
jgi:hypothetical protein